MAHDGRVLQVCFKLAVVDRYIIVKVTGDTAIVSSVEMSKCSPSPLKRVKREVPFANNVEEDDYYKVTESMKSHKEECPYECPTSRGMVCARCNHGIYRSFLSDCHMRMYQCRHPDERLELVSRHSCYGSAPYIMDVNRLQNVKDTLHDVEGHKDVERIDVDICPNDEDQETAIEVPDVCTNTSSEPISSSDYMKVDLHPDFIEDGSPVWMVFNGGKKITSKIRADAGIVVGCDTYAGLDFSGNVVVRNKHDNDFIGFVFGYRSNSQFYLVSWKAKSDKYWIGWPSVVKADAGIHIKLVNSSTGPGAYLRNALYSTKSVKDQVKLLWQDPKKQGWKHLLIYSWQLIHRPHIGLIRIKVFSLGKLLVDSGNVYDKTIKGGRVGVYAFSQENIEWHKMKFECNDKIPSNLISELPPDLQKISVVDSAHTWNNKSGL